MVDDGRGMALPAFLLTADRPEKTLRRKEGHLRVIRDRPDAPIRGVQLDDPVRTVHVTNLGEAQEFHGCTQSVAHGATE